MKKVFTTIAVIFLFLLLWMVLSLVSHRWRDLSISPKEGSRTLTILTYNTQRMGNFEKVGKNAVIAYLQQSGADVLCLEEAEVYKDSHYLMLDELRDAMAEYPYTYYDFKVYNHRRQYGNIVFSKYPLINKHTIRYASRGNITSCCDVVVEQDTLRLLVNCLESNHLTLNEKADTLFQKVGSAGKIRRRQAWQVRKAMIESPYPLMVVGDFNAIPVSMTYLCLSLGMRDCFLETSRGNLGITYERQWLGVRIDYILCSRSLKPYYCVVDAKTKASDHYPVMASIEWTPGSGSR